MKLIILSSFQNFFINKNKKVNYNEILNLINNELMKKNVTNEYLDNFFMAITQVYDNGKKIDDYGRKLPIDINENFLNCDGYILNRFEQKLDLYKLFLFHESGQYLSLPPNSIGTPDEIHILEANSVDNLFNIANTYKQIFNSSKVYYYPKLSNPSIDINEVYKFKKFLDLEIVDELNIL